MDSPLLPYVSVIVPIYNGEADLPDLLACLRSQDYPRDRVDYLLVDNGSRDRTAALLTAAMQTETITIRALSEPRIQSSYAARNLGIRTATSTILAFTDADCRPQPNWLSTLVQPFADETVGLVAGEIQALPGQTLLERHAERQETLSQKHTIAHSFCAYGQTANLAIRLEALKQVGLFRPYLTTGGDADICWRILRQTPWQFRFADGAIVRHRHRATLPELKSQWQRYGRSNRYLHDLHGVDLMREPTLQESVYRLTRWMVKELPISAAKLVLGKAEPVELVGTPIGLICAQARAIGQRQPALPAQAREIEWL
ncbi:glycosyltransferase [Myxacorys almedinensis]|uniref:Glycosyltransferase n=1 Tax=Myxacorys almedinensis A TaxID=2690445 RepID=A0A8J7Z3P2_9CYAN|nr:glycosyltransferase [Myxacorys almedinensis]NDJ17276.1 glycosyltransferase [Myxacorys almedinensis A]